MKNPGRKQILQVSGVGKETGVVARILTGVIVGDTFTMVEENFEFYCSEMLQNKGFPIIVGEYFHRMKEI